VLDEVEAYTITERNQLFYVEVIRTLAEFVVYGEKLMQRGLSQVSFFDILCERNTLQRFQTLLALNNRFVTMQLI
jgi:hypothetical protein